MVLNSHAGRVTHVEVNDDVESSIPSPSATLLKVGKTAGREMLRVPIDGRFDDPVFSGEV